MVAINTFNVPPSYLPEASTGPDSKCLTCEVMGNFVPSVSSGTEAMAAGLWSGIEVLTVNLAALVFVLYAIKLLFGGDLSRILKDALWLIVAAGLLIYQGPNFVNDIFEVTLATAGNASAVVLDSVPFDSGIKAPPSLFGSSDSDQTHGMVRLVESVEKNIYKVYALCEGIADRGSWHTPTPWIIAPLIFIPFALLQISYFCLFIVSIVSVQLVALFSPIILMLMPFKGSRSWVVTGFKVLISVVMVMIASSAIVALICWVTHLLGIGDVSTKDDISNNLSFSNPQVWTAIIAGWAGPALMIRATNLANSLTGSMLGSAESAVLAGGVFASAMHALRASNIGAGALWGLSKWAGGKLGKIFGGGGKNLLQHTITPR